MKLLQEIIHPDFPTIGKQLDKRSAARIILIDNDGKVPLLYSSKYDIYVIPGGGIEQGENIQEAVIREAKEETGCEVEILGEIGKIIEKRPAHGYTKGINLEQISYCYYGKVVSKGELALTQNEIEKGFIATWEHVDEVVNKMRNTSPSDLKIQLIKQRDLIIFQHYLEVFKKI